MKKMDEKLTEERCAKLLWIMDIIQYDTSPKKGEDLDDAIKRAAIWGNKMWEEMKGEFINSESPWYNKQHCGDCTSVAISCVTCHYESKLEEARNFIKDSNVLEILEDD